ncbi:MAG: extracellular solute-binding protein [Desulfobacteraceae bacterium]|nr:extracellular solute-binding protein [Desulfobacteraceae bacterium]
MLEKKTILTISAIILVGLVCTAWWYFAQEETSEIMIYTTNSGCELMLKPTIEKFTERTGIEISYIFPGGSGAVCNKIILEKDKPVADIAIASLPSMLSARDNGALEKYVSPEAKYFPTYFKDPDGYYTGWFAFFTHFAYNPIYVTDPPETYQDLLCEEYRGKIVYPDPTLSGNGLRFVIGVLKAMGEDAGYGFLAELEPYIFAHPAHEEGELIHKGEIWIHLTDSSVMTSEVMAEGLTNQKILITEEGITPGYVSIALTKGGPNPEGAKKFIDFMLSEEGQLFTPLGYGVPCREGMEDAIPEDVMEVWAPIFESNIISLDWEGVAENQGYWKDRWVEEVQPGG